MMSVYTRNLRNQCLRTLSSLLLNQRVDVITRSSFAAISMPGFSNVSCESSSAPKIWSSFEGARRFSSKSMRSKVEKRMQRESGKTLREIRRAKKLRKKLMTDEERLIYNLRRAKKKVALLLQKLKKYELPELPLPRHDPELFTAEQLQAYKKIGFRNKNYVPVGVRGVFGGVVQNMHLHWKFHETVQVCCDNFPKEKIKEMASMLTRLSGGIVVNVHNVKTIIMFRGRNYRQPKNLIPINTLTKRKALFKARFEQALESQKLNIKKIEQELRRKGVNPDDPVAMASIQRVASTFFNAIDKREGSPYVFREDKTTQVASEESFQQPQDAGDDSDQEELDRFIAEIEDAADKEWAEEESAEKEELNRIRYWNREDFGGRYQRFEGIRNEDLGNETKDRMKYRDQRRRVRASDSEVEGDDDGFESDGIGEVVPGSYEDDSDESNGERSQRSNAGRANSRGFGRNEMKPNGRKNQHTVREHALSDLEDITWDSEGEGRALTDSRTSHRQSKSSRNVNNFEQTEMNRRSHRGTPATLKGSAFDRDPFSESELAEWESDATSGDDEGSK
ncbi:CRM-domain containing factor CFM9, mitochondrial-like [Salvia splendens]|uniref:CRM-domain containing factor CFM9, mitochondrial-like n=1 Tax=Salvia splendens TaxID=180675 RepID=UPI001C26A9AE|nr:CRM-domain containing factor CFM9, mitochondrial-like [Salvia splendens]